MYTSITLLWQYPQRFVDGIGMYRTVTLALWGLVACSLTAGAFGWLSYSPWIQLMAIVPAVFLAVVLNIAFAWVFTVAANHESAVITALILFFLVIPAETLPENWPLFTAIVVAITSKFVLTYRKQHVFNAAALGAAAVSLPGFYEFSWWVSNPVLLWPTLLLGGLVVMKVRKWTPVLAFVGVGLLVYLFEGWRLGFALPGEFVTYFYSWPTIFLAFFMLTEPFTMPPTKRTQAWYGGMVGALANTTVFSPIFYMSPEVALLIGNALAYPFRLRQKLFLPLVSKELVAADTWEFVFKKPPHFYFKAGQYLEWMLPHEKADSRGERRYFTIASSPTEAVVRLALKVTEGGSTYKKELLQLQAGDCIIASQLAGDFMLPKNAGKLGMIAGGIGITPFRSHIRHMLDTQTSPDTKLLYCANTAAELAFVDEFVKAAAKLPLEVIPVISKEKAISPHESGYITADLLARRVPDFVERTWYLSGPPPMVDAYSDLLSGAGVPRKQIIKDFFPGLA